MFFTTATGRDRFARTVLYSVRPIERIRKLGATLAERMRKRTGGHMWVAGHMRRGDCKSDLLAVPRPSPIEITLFTTSQSFEKAG